MVASNVAAALTQKIQAGEWPVGTALPSERALAAQFCVGRTAVREAFKLLEGAQMIEQRKGYRPRVTFRPDPSSAAAMFDAAWGGLEAVASLEQARLFLELSVLSYAVEHATDGQIARLAQLVEAARHSTALDQFRQNDLAFHQALMAVADNPILDRLFESVFRRIIFERPDPHDFEMHRRAVAQEHKAIVQAILARDQEAAAAVMKRHLSRNYAVYVSKFLSAQ